MSTLAEIEAAVPALNSEELERLENVLRDIRRRRALPSGQPITNLSEFAGSLHLSEDPLAFQERIRGEWE